MLKTITLICLILFAAIACETKKADHSHKHPNGDTSEIVSIEPAGSHAACDSLVDIRLTGPTRNARVVPDSVAFDWYASYKRRILKREAMIDSFCAPGSGSNIKILKCAHFPAKTIADHICLNEESLKRIYPRYDSVRGGVRLYPRQKGLNGNDQKVTRFILVFTRKEPVPGTAHDSIYNDIRRAPILLLEADWLQRRICKVGEHTDKDRDQNGAALHFMTAHRLCTPRCPDDQDGNLLFDY